MSIFHNCTLKLEQLLFCISSVQKNCNKYKILCIQANFEIFRLHILLSNFLNRVLVGKPKGRGPLGRPRRRWVDNIRMDLQEVGCGHVDWIGLA